ncbi:MAG: PP2C family protein-serine/threonine phosphatase [Melioribacteraceae bacterium]|nr:PP2C family protein-serine/threonine phosphatase [Melioribacteraceae bacterium]
MLEPKIFYRKLDFLLAKINHSNTSNGYLLTIVNEVINTFGEDLHIHYGRIYQESENEFILMTPDGSKSIAKKVLSKEDEAVKVLIKNKSYIFDDPKFSIDSAYNNLKEYTIPAAITVRSPEVRYIILFELKSGWEREAVSLCLNAVVSSINQKLFNESIKSEIQQAVHIQQSLLPHVDPDISGFEIYGKSIAAELVGGDLYDYFYHGDENSFGVCIGDASGHGLPAALLVRDVVTGLRMGLDPHSSTTHTLKKLNRVIHRSVLSTRFISLFYANIEANGNMFYINAGHPGPLLYKKNEFIELESTGLIFGALPEIELQKKHATIESGDVLVLFTDGIFETSNYNDELFGIDRLKQTIADNISKNAKDLSKEVFNAAQKFSYSEKWQDDATVVVIKRL